MIKLAMIWQRESRSQPALETITDGALYYKKKYGRLPNFVNTPPGFLSDAEIAKLRERWTVATNAPAYFKNDIWLGVMTPPSHAAGESS